MGRVGVFLASMLYGASWVVLVINTIAIVASLREGQTFISYLPVLLASLGVILYVHYLAGWPPFPRREQPGNRSSSRENDR